MPSDSKPLKGLTLDQATQTGWAAGTGRDLENRTIEFGLLRIPKRDDPGERLKIFRQNLIDLIDYSKPDLVGYETPYWPRPPTKDQLNDPDFAPPSNINQETLQFLQWVRAIVMTTCAEMSVPCEHYAPSSWRKTAIGFGRAPKIDPITNAKPDSEFMKRAMKKRAESMGYTIDAFDESDAIGMLIHLLAGKPALERMQGDLLQHAGLLK